MNLEQHGDDLHGRLRGGHQLLDAGQVAERQLRPAQASLLAAEVGRAARGLEYRRGSGEPLKRLLGYLRAVLPEEGDEVSGRVPVRVGTALLVESAVQLGHRGELIGVVHHGQPGGLLEQCLGLLEALDEVREIERVPGGGSRHLNSGVPGQPTGKRFTNAK